MPPPTHTGSGAASAERQTVDWPESLLGRLAYLASLHDPATNRYAAADSRNAVSAGYVSGHDAGLAMSRAHERVFLDWLQCGLPQQWADLELYFRGAAGDPQAWFRAQSHRRLVPPSALEPERLLFLCDFEALSALVCFRDQKARCPAA